MDSLRVVVTGAGSGVGNGIVKALRLAGAPPTIVATDIGPLNAGLYRADRAEIWPPVESDGCLEAITANLKRLAADALLIGSEYDLAFYAAHRETIEAETGTRIVVSAPAVIDTANDKLETVKFLAANGLPHPRTTLPACLEAAVAAGEDFGWPVVVKPRRGTSSRGVFRVADAGDMGRCFRPGTGQIVQQTLGGGTGRLADEYTCSVFRLSDGTLLGPFTSRRSMRGGDSWVVEVGRFDELHPLMRDIGTRMAATGPLNVQLIMTADGPVPFEINARFSGTTAIRAHFGFNEPEMALRHFVLGETVVQPEIRHGVALRYTEEVFVEGAAVADLAPPLPPGKVNGWF